MLNYLVNYGIQKTEINHADLDINDRLALQDQINAVRSNYSQLLQLMDKIQGEIIDINTEMAKRAKELVTENPGARFTVLSSSDETYTELSTKLDAMKAGLSMVSEQIDFCKSDIRILNSVFYNKF